jgi:hypothetical protein
LRFCFCGVCRVARIIGFSAPPGRWGILHILSASKTQNRARSSFSSLSHPQISPPQPHLSLATRICRSFLLIFAHLRFLENRISANVVGCCRLTLRHKKKKEK